MSERIPGEVETCASTGETQKSQRHIDSRRIRLFKLLRTQAGRQQALLFAEILSPPVSARRRRAPTALD